jgi:hypothetical protein
MPTYMLMSSLSARPLTHRNLGGERSLEDETKEAINAAGKPEPQVQIRFISHSMWD